MDLKWILTLVLLLVAPNAFSSEIKFNEVIAESNSSQMALAHEIRTQVSETKRKNPEQITVSQAVLLEGSVLKVY